MLGDAEMWAGARHQEILCINRHAPCDHLLSHDVNAKSALKVISHCDSTLCSVKGERFEQISNVRILSHQF